jgi:hypothetical protein
VLTTPTSTYIVGRNRLTGGDLAALHASTNTELAELWTPRRIRATHTDDAAAQRTTAQS